jgi:acetyltransferase-like isoleucine patch superfamily enzyme
MNRAGFVTRRLGRAVLNTVVASPLVPAKLRVRMYRWAGVPVGSGSGILSHVYVNGPHLNIGNGCFINRFCMFDAGAPLTIEDNVFIGFRATVLTSSHEPGNHQQRARLTTQEPVTIGAGSWIGANTTILPGVTIGQGCVIAAGSVVTQDTKPDTLYAGVPAIPKKRLAQ